MQKLKLFPYLYPSKNINLNTNNNINLILARLAEGIETFVIFGNILLTATSNQQPATSNQQPSSPSSAPLKLKLKSLTNRILIKQY